MAELVWGAAYVWGWRKHGAPSPALLTIYAGIPLARRGVISQRQPAKPSRHQVVIPMQKQKRFLEQDLEHRVEKFQNFAEDEEADPYVHIVTAKVDFRGQLAHCVAKAMIGKLVARTRTGRRPQEPFRQGAADAREAKPVCTRFGVGSGARSIAKPRHSGMCPLH